MRLNPIYTESQLYKTRFRVKVSQVMCTVNKSLLDNAVLSPPPIILGRIHPWLKSNRLNHAYTLFWKIDLANRPNSYLESHDLRSSPQSD